MNGGGSRSQLTGRICMSHLLRSCTSSHQEGLAPGPSLNSQLAHSPVESHRACFRREVEFRRCSRDRRGTCCARNVTRRSFQSPDQAPECDASQCSSVTGASDENTWAALPRVQRTRRQWRHTGDASLSRMADEAQPAVNADRTARSQLLYAICVRMSVIADSNVCFLEGKLRCNS